MSNLLRANFARLKKDRIFWLCMAFMFLAGVYGIIMRYFSDPTAPIDTLIFIYPVLIGIVSSAFSSLFIGTEHSDGTIRNKLVVGHKRSAVYLSNLITCSAAGILMCVSYLASIAVLGLPLLGLPKAEPLALIVIILVSFLMVITFAALFTLLCMLWQNKAAAAVVCVIMVFTMLTVSSYVESRLEEPEYYKSYSVSENAGASSAGVEPNPNYLEGTKREIVQFIYDFLPTGAGIEIASGQMHMPYLPLYSLFIILLSTTSGMLLFRKKDIK